MCPNNVCPLESLHLRYNHAHALGSTPPPAAPHLTFLSLDVGPRHYDPGAPCRLPFGQMPALEWLRIDVPDILSTGIAWEGGDVEEELEGGLDGVRHLEAFGTVPPQLQGARFTTRVGPAEQHAGATTNGIVRNYLIKMAAWFRPALVNGMRMLQLQCKVRGEDI